jgi:hypothetical protein
MIKHFFAKWFVTPSTDISCIPSEEHAEPGVYCEGRRIIISNGKRYMDAWLSPDQARELGCLLIAASYEERRLPKKAHLTQETGPPVPAAVE